MVLKYLIIMVGDVLDLTKSKTNIIDEITNGIIVTKNTWITKLALH